LLDKQSFDVKLRLTFALSARIHYAFFAMPKLFKISDLLDHFEGITEYRIERWIEKGILDPPLPRDSDSETRLWTASQVRKAEERIRELSRPNPPTVGTMRPLSERMREKIRAKGRPLRMY
jgi:hypothetical protein